MKVTFLIPPVLDGTQGVDRCFGCNYGIYFLPLLAALYSATILKDEVERVSVLDFAAEKKTKEQFMAFAGNDDSDIYIFYTVFLCQATDMAARTILRKENSKARYIFTGPQATYSPEVFLDRSDTVSVRGEPEFILLDLVRNMKTGSDLRNVQGISFYSDLEIVHNSTRNIIEDIDAIPIPDRRMLDHRPYYNPKLHHSPHTACLTSRGCYGQCWYCVPNSLSYARELEHKKCYGKKPPARLHSVKRVIEEFRRIKSEGFRSISVIDDEFLWTDERTIKICEGIKGLGLEWSCLTRPDKVTEPSVKAMARAGCSYVDLGTESFDSGVLKAIKKDMSPEDTKKAVRLLKKYGISPEINVLLGATPHETESTIKKTLKEVEELNIDYVLFSIANPFPGTDFYDAAKKNGWLVYGEYRPVDPAKESIISYPHLSKKRLEELVSQAYMTHYFNPRYMLRELFRLKDFNDLKNKLYTALRLIKRNWLRR